MLTAGPRGQLPRWRRSSKRLSAKWDNHLLPWPPRSTDLTPWDFFLWGFVKDNVYVPPLPISLKELRDRITHALQTITADMLHRVWDEFDYRVDACRETQKCTHWRFVINAWETWTVDAADGVSCARVRWEINLLLTFETAPFLCVYPVYTYSLHGAESFLRS